MAQLNCHQCGGKMKKKVQSSGNCSGIALALVLIAVGLALCATGIGALLGVPIIICALFVGGKRKKIWKCTKCGYLFERG